MLAKDHRAGPDPLGGVAYSGPTVGGTPISRGDRIRPPASAHQLPTLTARGPCRVAVSFVSTDSRPRHRGQIGGFLMEAPTTSAIQP